MPSPVANAFPKRTITTTKTGASAVHGQAVVSPMSQLPRFQSVLPVLGVWQLQGALPITQTFRPNNCGRPTDADEQPSGSNVFWPSASATTCAAATASSIFPPHHSGIACHPTRLSVCERSTTPPPHRALSRDVSHSPCYDLFPFLLTYFLFCLSLCAAPCLALFCLSLRLFDCLPMRGSRPHSA